MIYEVYTVNGSWPFPVDMLRYDNSEPATPEDQKLIEHLSREYLDTRDEIVAEHSICLRKRDSCYLIADKRWRSFGWTVVGSESAGFTDPEVERYAALRESAKAKLTAEEWEALQWYGLDAQQ